MRLFVNYQHLVCPILSLIGLCFFFKHDFFFLTVDILMLEFADIGFDLRMEYNSSSTLSSVLLMG